MFAWIWQAVWAVQRLINLETLEMMERTLVRILIKNRNLGFIIIIIIIILGVSFMQDIYTYIPETNHVPREHCVATILM